MTAPPDRPWRQGPASTSSRRADQPARSRSLKPLIRCHGRVLEPHTPHGPNPEDPDDRHVALITALIKIFATRPRRLPHRAGPAAPTM